MSDEDEDNGEDERSLDQRLADARRNCPDIPKTGYNSHHGYDYLEDQVVSDKAPDALDDEGLDFDLQMEDFHLDGKNTIIGWDIRLFVPETGEERHYKWFSEGYDGGDKSISKAATQARKDWLRMQLTIPGGVENEADTSTDQQAADGDTEPKAAPPSGSYEINVHNGLDEHDGQPIKEYLKNLGFRYDGDGTWETQVGQNALETCKEKLDEYGADYEVDET
jgi:hypothetical protein